MAAAVLLGGVAMLASAVMLDGAIHYGQELTVATREGKPYNSYSESWLASDFARGGDRLYAVAIGYGAQIDRLRAIDANQRGWYAQLMDVAHAATLSPLAGARLSSLELWLQYKLLIDFGGFRSFADLGHQAAVSMPDVAVQLCRRVPTRDDYETMFLLNLPAVAHNDTTREEAILRDMLAAAPGHRAAQWLLGRLYLSQKGREAEGKALMRDAARRGAATIFPIRDSQLQEALQP